jgi:bifunctional polynucleotide phosphatase/kinase
MWNLFKSEFNSDHEIDLKESIYCGDAAGRNTKGAKDHSDADYKFALNIGITFKVPE